VFEDLDELAMGLAENDISRRQAVKWAGYSVLGAALSSMGFAESAEALTARQRRRCRSKGGIPLDNGNCHCAFKCGADIDQFKCGGDPRCRCRKTAEGRGFCVGVTHQQCSGLRRCSRSTQCPSGFKCVSATCCDNPVCLPACGSTRSSGRQVAASGASGMTDDMGPSDG
jgi:hypothetical protein